MVNSLLKRCLKENKLEKKQNCRRKKQTLENIEIDSEEIGWVCPKSRKGVVRLVARNWRDGHVRFA